MLVWKVKDICPQRWTRIARVKHWIFCSADWIHIVWRQVSYLFEFWGICPIVLQGMTHLIFWMGSRPRDLFKFLWAKEKLSSIRSKVHYFASFEKILIKLFGMVICEQNNLAWKVAKTNFPSWKSQPLPLCQITKWSAPHTSKNSLKY